MARQGKDKSELIKCEYCGEMYSRTYKHCPFCNEDGTGSWDEPVREEDYEDDDVRGGGKRLAGSGRSGKRKTATVGTVIYGIISAALIIAAAGIVISIVRPLFGSSRPAPTAAPENSAVVDTLPGDNGLVDAQPTVDPNAGVVTPPDNTVPTEQPMVTAAPISVTAPTSFKLNREDFTLDHAGETFQMKATLTPADASADITWTSSDPNIASVSWNGVVTAVSPGTVKVTASVAGVGEKSCVVRCTFKSTAASGGEGSATTTTTTTTTTTSSSISLSREDFTLSHVGDSWRLTVSGSSGGAVTWETSDASVATVGADGTVTAVGAGTCRVTATVDGMSAKCIVRCSF